MTLAFDVQAPAEAGNLPRFLRPSEIKEKTGLPAEVIYAALTSGELPALDVSRPALPGKKKKPLWYVDPEDVRVWLESKKTRAGGK